LSKHKVHVNTTAHSSSYSGKSLRKNQCWKRIAKHKTIGVRLSSKAVIAVEFAVKHSFVSKGMQTRLKGQYNVEVTLCPCLSVKLLITAITVIDFGLVLIYGNCSIYS